jgi:acetyl esterase/lipase
MWTRRSRFAALLAVLLAPLALPAAGAQAQLRLPGLLSPPPPPPPAIAPVADPITRDPLDGNVRGTVVMVHAGGWAGHDANAQRILFEHPGDVFTARGWRVVSIDYDEGTAGLGDVLNAVGEELSRNSGGGPTCIYGESAGAHLALVAAARLTAIDCVIGLGTPTDLALYESDAAVSDNPQVRVIGYQMSRFFGTTADALAPWTPVTLAPSIRADVLLINEADDAFVSAAHTERFKAARPTTQTLVLEAGDPADPSAKFVHGTVSAAGRGAYLSVVGAFADRLTAANQAEKDAAKLGCPSVTRSLRQVGAAKIQAALVCLARRDATARLIYDRRWRRTSTRLRGEINAARIWAQLRRSTAGRRALAAGAKKRAKLAVAVSDRSQVTLRASR